MAFDKAPARVLRGSPMVTSTRLRRAAWVLPVRQRGARGALRTPTPEIACVRSCGDVHHGNGTRRWSNETRHPIRVDASVAVALVPAADDRGGIGHMECPDAGVTAARATWTRGPARSTRRPPGGFPRSLRPAGFDLLAGDPLGGFTLEIEDFVGMTQDLVARAEAWCAGRIVSCWREVMCRSEMAAAAGHCALPSE